MLQRQPRTRTSRDSKSPPVFQPYWLTGSNLRCAHCDLAKGGDLNSIIWQVEGLLASAWRGGGVDEGRARRRGSECGCGRPQAAFRVRARPDRLAAGRLGSAMTAVMAAEPPEGGGGGGRTQREVPAMPHTLPPWARALPPPRPDVHG